MHIYRRHARYLSWYDEEGEPTNRNPFKKFRAHPQRSRTSRLESGLTPAHAEGDVRSSEERQRRREITSVLGEPGPAEGMDPARGVEETVNNDRNELEPSPHSNEPINVSQGKDDADGNGPRQRRGPLAKLMHRNDDDVTLTLMDSKSDQGKQQFTVVGQLKATLFNSWINILLVAAPVGIIVNYLHLDPVVIFVINFIAIIPLAAMLSYATEEIALRTGETIGGLLNATFGNAVELIVAILALVDGQVVIVQTSLIGSMLSNLLLVMGMCFFFGGLNRLEQNFNVVVAQTAASLLALAVGSLVIPTAFHTWSDAGASGIAPLSRGTSVILLVVYGAYLFFQLKSHTEMYNRPSPKSEKRSNKISEGDASKGIAQIGQMTATLGAQRPEQVQIQIPEPAEDEPETPQLNIWVAVFTLAASTVLVALCAEFMVDSIDAITSRGHISETFVGLILLPIVGNAAEHATAVTVACKDKMDLAIGVAVGSSMQIALLVLPLTVVIGWMIGNDDMTLYFDGFQVILLFVAVLLVNYLISDGKSHWLEGVLLMTLYLIIAVAAWFYPTKSEVAA
ncbi:sodium/calcium transporter [Thermoascus aurantiacus ATCC 26904]